MLEKLKSKLIKYDAEGNRVKYKHVPMPQALVNDKYAKAVEFLSSFDSTEGDTPNLMPVWFRLLHKHHLKHENSKFLLSFYTSRLKSRDYTLPLPDSWYDSYYKKPLTLQQRNMLLSLIAKFASTKERSFLMRMRAEKYVNQYYKLQLYEIARTIDQQENVYRALYDAGFGFEFNMLANAYSGGESLQDTLADMLSQMSSLVQMDTLFQDAMRSLRSAISVNTLTLALGYVGITYMTYYMMGLEYTTTPAIFVPGITLINWIIYYKLIGVVIVSLVFACLGWLYSRFRISTVIMYMSDNIFDIIQFFESFKFYSTLKMLIKTGSLSESRMLRQSITSIETAEISAVLNTKLDEIMASEECPDPYYAFLTSSRFFREEDIVYLVSPNKKYSVRGTLEAGLDQLLQVYATNFKIREKNDMARIQAYGEILSAVTQAGITLLFLYGDMQAFNIVV